MGSEMCIRDSTFSDCQHCIEVMETGGEELSLLSLEREDGVYVPSSRVYDSAHRISADLPYDDLSGVSLATCWLSSSVKDDRYSKYPAGPWPNDSTHLTTTMKIF